MAGCGRLGFDGLADDASPEPPVDSLGLSTTRLSAGEHHACAVRDGVIYCFGRNDFGNLGVGDIAERNQPVEVTTLASGGTIQCNDGASCLSAPDRGVLCWGRGGSGRLGNGNTDDVPSPGPVTGLSQDARAFTGNDHLCALDGDRVRCWGRNERGQLGDGALEHRSLPTEGLVLDAVSLALGNTHSCALLGSGDVACWGDNADGQLGIPLGDGDQPFPVIVPGIDAPAVQAASYGAHSCAVVDDGRLFCWGSNEQRALGNDDPNAQPATVVAGLDAVAQVTTGADHTCALLRNGEVWCWGRNHFGQLGDGSTGSARSTPQPVPGLEAVVVDAGEHFTCALSIDDDVYCWGENTYGQLGNRGPDTATPSRVLF